MSLEVSQVRRSYDRGFASHCSKVASASATSATYFGTRFQTLIRQETVFVYLTLGKISSYAAMMDTFQMKKYRDSIFIRLFPHRLDSIGSLQAVCRLLKIHTHSRCRPACHRSSATFKSFYQKRTAILVVIMGFSALVRFR